VLRLLLDEHIAPAVAVAMRRAEPSVHVESLVEWQDGRYIGLPDDVIIAAACRDGRTLGAVLVNHGAIRQKDVRTLARTLVALWRAQRRHKWADRCVYARP
jgi:hypothetical protein